MALKREKKTSEAGPPLCAWNDHGDGCPHRGILSPGTAGAPWYCREHFYRLRGYKDMEDEGLHGNQLPKRPIRSYAVEQIRKLVTRSVGGSLSKFLPPVESREPDGFNKRIADVDSPRKRAP